MVNLLVSVSAYSGGFRAPLTKWSTSESASRERFSSTLLLMPFMKMSRTRYPLRDVGTVSLRYLYLHPLLDESAPGGLLKPPRA